MLKPVIDVIHMLMENYRSLAAFVLLMFFVFPFVTTVWLVSERAGMWSDKYALAHQALLDASMIQATKDKRIMTYLGQNQVLMLKLLYVGEGACLNEATTTESKENCRPPVNYSDLLSRERNPSLKD